jgi:2-C-methyl-D-erythritol 4-phosphate cytidylyltransferase
VAAKTGGAIPVIRPSESLRKISESISIPVNRNEFRLVQTPQTFQAKLIKKAYEKPYEERFTDDATVFEADGNTITFFEGNIENIKITRAFDLKIVEASLS